MPLTDKQRRHLEVFKRKLEDPSLPAGERAAIQAKADEYEALNIEERVDDPFHPKHLRSIADRTWVTRDGEVYDVDDMEDWHVLRAIRVMVMWKKDELLPSKRKDLTRWIKLFKAEAQVRNDAWRKENGLRPRKIQWQM